MSKKKFFRSRYSPLFLALAAVFSSGPAVCRAQGIVVNEDVIYGNIASNEFNKLSDNTLINSRTQPGGAAIFNNGKISTIGEAGTSGVFSENEVMRGSSSTPKAQGGAIYNASTGKIDAIYVGFENNTSSNSAGAIYNEGEIGQIGHPEPAVTFLGNAAENGNGGAINNASSGTIREIHAVFTGNKAKSGGGAINNSGEITVISGSFEENEIISESGLGGAISNTGKIGTINSNFIKNGVGIGGTGASYMKTGRGGAIHNESMGSIVSINGSFVENEASSSGGAIQNNGFIGTITGEFSNNKVTNGSNSAVSDGGALTNLGEITSIVNTTFTSNISGKYGGAIDSSGTIGEISGNVFANNATGWEGGAIANERGAISKVSGNVFRQNHSEDYGGAVSNYKGTVGDMSDNLFVGNAAGIVGGAIFNDGILADVSNTRFIGNSAGQEGGAIYNQDTVTFSGENTFSGNTAAGKPNDITNEGTLNFGAAGQEHEKTTIGSGIDGNGEMNLNSGILEIAENRTVEQGTAVFAGGTNVLVTVGDGNRILDGHAASASEVENLASQKDKSIIRTTGGLNIADGARLTVTGANAGKTYLIAVDEGGNVRNAGDGWKGGNLIDSSNVLLDFRRVEGDTETGTVMVTSRARDAREVLPCVDIPDNLNALVSGQKIDVDSTTAGIRFLSRATDSRYLPGGRTQMEEVINSAAQIATAGAVRNITYSGAGMFNRAVEKHLSLSRTLQLGDAVRLHEKEHADLWVDLIGMHQRNHGMPVCSGKECGDRTRFGHRIDMGGIVAGIDRSFDANRHAGIALMAGTGSASSKGDFSHTKNDVDFWGASLYGGYDRDNWNVMGNVSYTHFDSDIDQTLPATLQMGNRLRADISSHQWSAGIRGEYRIRFDNGFDLLPHAGLRYDRLVMSGFRTKADAGSAFSTKKDTMNIYSLPVGAGIQGTFRNRNGWTFTPQADLTAIFAAGDIRDRTEVSAAGLDATDSIHTRIVDRTSIMAGIGFDMQKGNKSFGLHYDAMYSSRQMWQGLMAKVVLRFE